ncbi:MAG: lipopolysaccharide heptosyltransferase II [Betaproteobacteria bacterium]|nr:lipopolysaccharide heptosyltransferase II [Betaproteobacteria bacterium]NDA54932.1 lipopolysaccharide heptosyltransferase II [Betaproteobacteria bacterium]
MVPPNWVGDAVMAQPLLAQLARRSELARLAVLADGLIADVFRAMPQRPELIRFQERHGQLQLQARTRLASQLRKERFTHALILPHSIKSALIPWLAGIPQRLGYLGEHRYGLVNCRPAKSAVKIRDQSMHDYYLGLSLCFSQAAQATAPSLEVEPQALFEQQRRFGLSAYWVFAPGAEFGPSKQWPLAHWQSLASLLPQDQVIAILGGARDQPFGLAITQSARPGQTIVNLCGQTSMAQAIALIAGAQVVVSNDSGLMHVAAALQRPQLAVFGSTDPKHSGPNNPQALVHWLKLACSPCFQRQCPLGHYRCLHDIHPEALARDLKGLAQKPLMLES